MGLWTTTPLSAMDVGHAQYALFLSMDIATRVYVDFFHKLCINIQFTFRPESRSKHLLGNHCTEYGMHSCVRVNIRPHHVCVNHSVVKESFRVYDVGTEVKGSGYDFIYLLSTSASSCPLDMRAAVSLERVNGRLWCFIWWETSSYSLLSSPASSSSLHRKSYFLTSRQAPPL